MLVVVEAQESNLHEPLPPENHPYDFTTKGGHCDFRIFEYIYMSDRKKTASNHTKPHGQTGGCGTPLGDSLYTL
jgi:hypothetical protein